MSSVESGPNYGQAQHAATYCVRTAGEEEKIADECGHVGSTA